MLRVTTLYAGAATTARYYTKYLAAPGEEQGRWFGLQVAGFGLYGDVGTESLERLLAGCDPTTGATLGQPLKDRTLASGKVVRAVAGFDATLSAPKSLSVWWALTGDERLAECHDVAVEAVVRAVERVGSTTRVRSNGGRLHLDTGGLTVAAFRQTTSRLDDPQLHTHLVIAGKVQTADGRWLALDARVLKQHQRAFGGLYQSVLRAELAHRFGVGFEAIVNGQAEIAGIPDGLLAVFSKRAVEVRDALDVKLSEFRAREGRDPTPFERAAMEREASADTRQHKTGNAVTDLRSRWLAEAGDLGVVPEALTAAIQAAGRTAERAPVVVSVGEVLRGLAERRSVWRRLDVLREVTDRQQPTRDVSGEQWAVELDRVVDRVLSESIDLDPTGDTGPVRGSDGRSVWIEPVAPQVTSRLVLEQEAAIIDWANAAQRERPQQSTSIKPDGFDALQVEAAAAVAGRDRLVVIVGPAGAGKTTMLRAAVNDLHEHGRVVFGVAPTAKAARVLEDETGMRSDTLAKLLHEWQRPDGPRPEWDLAPGTTVIVDEAGMVGTTDLHHLIRLAEQCDWRLALIGDHRQLQAVGRGGMFAEICTTARAVELEQIHRFTNTWEAAASLQLRAGKPAALDEYGTHERIRPGTLTDHLDHIAEAWVARTTAGETLAITHHRRRRHRRPTGRQRRNRPATRGLRARSRASWLRRH